MKINKFIFTLISTTTVAIIITGCGDKIEDKDPAVFYKNYMNKRFEISPDKVVGYFSAQSLKDNDTSADELITQFKKTAEDLRFSGFKLEDIKVDKVIKYDDNTSIIVSTFKYKTSDKAEEQFSNDVAVVSQENGQWKINYGSLIKHYQYKDSCGNAGKITLCINDSYIYPTKTLFSGEINNQTNDTYMFGFASPVSTLTVLANKAEVRGNFPSVHNDQSNSKVGPGKRDIFFYFGNELDPILVESKPVYFAINQLKKSAWGGMPELSDKGQQINVYLKESSN